MKRRDGVDVKGPGSDRFRGTLLTPQDAGYEDARGLFNERLVRRPGLIAQCAGVADVLAALQLARNQGLAVTVRGGGHSGAGWSSIDGGLVVDLTLMRGIRVEPAARTAWVGGGARAMDLIIEAGEFGLAPVTGVSPKVGLGGLLLGLGEGYLTPKHGFGTDNVLAFELVTADGSVLQVSADDHPELFWAMRGAGANFGVVTAMQVRLHPVPEHAVGGWIAFGHRDVRRVTTHVWEVMQYGSEHYFPLAIYDRDDEGRPRVKIIPGHTGPIVEADREVGALRRCATATSDETRSMSYIELVNEIGGPRDDVLDRGARQVWNLYRFPFERNAERQMDTLLEQAARLRPSAHFNLWRTVPIPAPAPPSVAPRLPGISIFLASYWRDAADDEEELQAAEETAAAFVNAGVVTEAANAMNHVSTIDQTRVRRLYGGMAYERLAQIKSVYDPANLFQYNCNVKPMRDANIQDRHNISDRK